MLPREGGMKLPTDHFKDTRNALGRRKIAGMVDRYGTASAWFCGEKGGRPANK
jgi:hypothetical protein